MSESILRTIRETTIGNENDTSFDSALILHINTAMSILKQLGIGENNDFSVSGDNDTWSDAIGFGLDYELIKSYVQLKVRLLFDPPASATIVETYKEEIKELEWRIEDAVLDRKKHANGDENVNGRNCV